jgi:hypothetical protein
MLLLHVPIQTPDLPCTFIRIIAQRPMCASSLVINPTILIIHGSEDRMFNNEGEGSARNKDLIDLRDNIIEISQVVKNQRAVNKVILIL